MIAESMTPALGARPAAAHEERQAHEQGRVTRR